MENEPRDQRFNVIMTHLTSTLDSLGLNLSVGMWGDWILQSWIQSQADCLQLRRGDLTKMSKMHKTLDISLTMQSLGGQPVRRKDVFSWSSLLLLPLIHLLLINISRPLLRGGWQRGDHSNI